MVSVGTKVKLDELRISSLAVEANEPGPSWHIPRQAYLAVGVALVS